MGEAEETSPIKLEGMAAWGRVISAQVEPCGRKGTARVVARTRDGRMLATGCMEEAAARRVATLVRLYIKSWSELIVGS